VQAFSLPSRIVYLKGIAKELGTDRENDPRLPEHLAACIAGTPIAQMVV